ncbi:hypothetical protein DENSPDRAFT_882141 [Dentipellis sp. KUC8613]|nr:hypothetical protein DENSPDRAFT_882141 [Dentipellis sp. KUC8613]
MCARINEISVDEIFDIFIPGDDPSPEARSKFVSIATESGPAESQDRSDCAMETGNDRDGEPATAAAPQTKPKVNSWVEWHCMIDICKISKSVVDAAQSAGSNPSEPLFKTYDTSSWPVQPGIKLEDAMDIDDSHSVLSAHEEPEGEAGDRPSGGVYAVNARTERFVAISDATLRAESKISDADKDVRTGSVGHCSWADLVVPIEVEVDRSYSAFTFSDKQDPLLIDTKRGRNSLDLLLHHVGHVFTHQHRTHVYVLYVFRHQARILYFDRAGCIVSEPFQYDNGTYTPLHRFFWRLAHMSDEERGYDHSAVLASEKEVKKMVEYARDAPTEYIGEQIYRALSWDSEKGAPRSTQWPVYKVTMGSRSLLIARPIASSHSLYGRCTRGYIAYDPEERTVSFLKDCWRADHPRAIAEHEVYKRLAAHGVSNIATCEGSEDVLDSRGRWQVTKAHSAVGSKSRIAFGHYRILLREICRPLIDFKDFRELASLLYDAVTAHEDAWCKAAVLHRDISVNNILIFEEGKGSNVTRRGILNDWDACKYREEMDESTTPRRPNLTGTWYFRSALSLQCPYKPYRVSDDIESFVHVYQYCVYRFHITVDDLPPFINALYGDMCKQTIDGVIIGGRGKLGYMMSSLPMDIYENCSTLDDCLGALHQVYYPHYKAIDFASYKRLYCPQAAHGTKRDRAPVREIVEDNTKAMDTHTKLKDVFLRYGGRVKDAQGNPTIVWEEDELQKTEDLFAHTSLAEPTNAQLSSAMHEGFEDMRREKERAVKRLEVGSGSATVPTAMDSDCDE